MEAGFGASELSSQFAALDAGGGASGGADPHCGAPASSAAPAVAAETAQAAQAVLAQAQDPVGGEAALLDSLVMTARDAAEGGVTGMLHGAVPPGAAVAAPHAWSLHAQQQAHAVHAAQAQTQVYVAHAHAQAQAQAQAHAQAQLQQHYVALAAASAELQQQALFAAGGGMDAAVAAQAQAQAQAQAAATAHLLSGALPQHRQPLGGLGHPAHPPLPPPPHAALPETVFRLLCPIGRAGSVLGKGGCIIRQLREETGARIKLGEVREGMDERVIGIAAVETPEAPWSAAQEALFRVVARIVESDGALLGDVGAGGGGAGRTSAAAARLGDGAVAVGASGADGDTANGGGGAQIQSGSGGKGGEGGGSGGADAQAATENSVKVRLIVPASQIGCLLGKGGTEIERIHQASGADIFFLSGDAHLLQHAHALEDDSVLQVSGEVGCVYAALRDITTRLRANPSSTGSAALAAAAGVPHPQARGGMHRHGVGYPLSRGFPVGAPGGHHHGDAARHSRHTKGDAWAPGGMTPGGTALYSLPREGSGEACFRILCPVSRVGVIIGKNGSIVQQMREETGARFKITGQVTGVDERVIVISAPDDADAPFSAVQEGLFRVHARLMQGDDDEEDEDEDGDGEEVAVGAGSSEGGEAEFASTVESGQGAVAAGETSAQAAGSGTSAGAANGAADEPYTPQLTTTRLLVPAAHIGCLLGKRGVIIQQMREETSAKIRVLPPEQVPWALALPGDELVQIVGTLSAARAALHEISTRLRASPGRGGGDAYRSMPPWPPAPTGMNDVPPAGARAYATVTGALRGEGLPNDTAGIVATAAAGAAHDTGESVSVAVAVPAVASGSIIGRGGCNIRQVREISGARVKMHESAPGSTQRMVEFTGTAQQCAIAQALVDDLLAHRGARNAAAPPLPASPMDFPGATGAAVPQAAAAAAAAAAAPVLPPPFVAAGFVTDPATSAVL